MQFFNALFDSPLYSILWLQITKLQYYMGVLILYLQPEISEKSYVDPAHLTTPVV